MPMLLNASLTAETTCMRNSPQHLSSALAPPDARSLHAADTVRSATSRCDSVPGTSRRITGSPSQHFPTSTTRSACGNSPFVVVPCGAVSPSVARAKRVLDLVGGSVAFALTLPLYPFVAVAIPLDTPGPIFIRPPPAGLLLDSTAADRDAPPPHHPLAHVHQYKFRTMVVNAEAQTS